MRHYINTVDGRYQGLFGYLNSGANISNLTVHGSVTSGYDKTTGVNIGGVIGRASGSKTSPVYVTNCTNYVNVTGYSKYAAGIVGYAGTYVIIDRCANYGTISLSHDKNTQATDAAGIAYLNATSDTITNSYNCGKVTANNNVGGIYASTVNATVTNVYNTGYVHANRTNGSGYQCHGAIRPMANTTAETNLVTNAYAKEDFLFNELNTTIITNPEAWSGGEVAYKLGAAFGQEIGVDPLPVLGGMTVYEIERPDGTKFYSNQDLKYYTRDNLTPGRIGTYCLEYASAIIEGATFYRLLYKTLDDLGDPLKVVFEEVTALEAGQPYIFLPEDEALTVYYVDENKANDPGHFNGLYGTFEDIHDGAFGAAGNILEGNYLVSNNKIMRCGEYCALSAHRAYIKMDQVALKDAVNAPKPVAGRKLLLLGKEEMEEQITTKLPASQMTDETDGPIYDILGRRIDTPIKHGVYIKNGQKYIQ